jgi:phosphate transport system protein
MRDAYHDELDAITEELVEMTRLVGTALSSATQALLEADVTVAELVIDGDAAVNALRDRVERRTVDLIARQQPVAGDLRMLTTGLRITSDLERSGDMAVHIAKLARRKYPACAVPTELQGTIRDMGAAAAAMVDKAAEVIRTRDLALAGELESDDDVIDALHKTLLITMLAPAWPHGVDTAIDLALAGRYYERFADHAVSVARQVMYLVTGESAVRA